MSSKRRRHSTNSTARNLVGIRSSARAESSSWTAISTRIVRAHASSTRPSCSPRRSIPNSSPIGRLAVGNDRRTRRAKIDGDDVPETVFRRGQDRPDQRDLLLEITVVAAANQQTISGRRVERTKPIETERSDRKSGTFEDRQVALHPSQVGIDDEVARFRRRFQRKEEPWDILPEARGRKDAPTHIDRERAAVGA